MRQMDKEERLRTKLFVEELNNMRETRPWGGRNAVACGSHLKRMFELSAAVYLAEKEDWHPSLHYFEDSCMTNCWPTEDGVSGPLLYAAVSGALPFTDEEKSALMEKMLTDEDRKAMGWVPGDGPHPALRSRKAARRWWLRDEDMTCLGYYDQWPEHAEAILGRAGSTDGKLRALNIMKDLVVREMADSYLLDAEGGWEETGVSADTLFPLRHGGNAGHVSGELLEKDLSAIPVFWLPWNTGRLLAGLDAEVPFFPEAGEQEGYWFWELGIAVMHSRKAYMRFMRNGRKGMAALLAVDDKAMFMETRLEDGRWVLPDGSHVPVLDCRAATLAWAQKKILETAEEGGWLARQRQKAYDDPITHAEEY